MIAKYNGIVYKDNELQLFSTGAIFVKPLKMAFWDYEFDFIEYGTGTTDISIDVNDTVLVTLTEWGATYLNATNTYRKITNRPEIRYLYKTDYKRGDKYEDQFWKLVLEFKDGFRFDREKPFKQLKKVR